MYYPNKKADVIHFFSTKEGWSKTINSIDYFHSGLFPSGGMLFKGEILIDNFLEALDQTLQDFDFLFCRFYRVENVLRAGYSNDKNESKQFSFQLEVERNKKNVLNTHLRDVLPKKINSEIKSGIVNNLEGLPIGVLKLVLLKDGFGLGYFLNHAFFDQSSIVYFFKYLSQRYSCICKKIKFNLKKPISIDVSSIHSEDSLTFKNIRDFRLYGESMGLRYKDFWSLPSRVHSNMVTLDISFQIEALEHLKHSSEKIISKNDIIHATLLKIYSLNSNLPLDDTFCFTYPSNMRKRLHMGEEITGNIIKHCKLSLKTRQMKSLEIIELAQFNREHVSKINVKKYKKNLIWFKCLQRFNENPLDYLPSKFNVLHCGTTNWASFDYSQISFHGSTPIALLAPTFASLGVSLTSFNNIYKQKTFNTSIYVPSDCLTNIMKLGERQGLFRCQKHT